MTAGLTDREVDININTSFHTFKDVETKIHVCPTCKCRLLSFAAGVHCHKIHTVDIDGGATKIRIGVVGVAGYCYIRRRRMKPPAAEPWFVVGLR